MEDNTREGIRGVINKELVVCFQDMVGKNNYPVQFKYGQKIYISSSLILFLSSKEEVDMDESLSNMQGSPT